MGSLDKQQYSRASRSEVQSPKGYVHIQKWTAPAAASATAVLNAQTMNAGGTVTTFVGQPDKPRTLQYVASGATSANVTVNGTDIRGNAISETVALNGTTPVNGTKAFATITSIVLPTVGATTLNVGTTAVLGLERALPANTLVAITMDGATTTASAVTTSVTYGAISSNTITFATAPNGTHNYLVCYVTQELTASKNSTT